MTHSVLQTILVWSLNLPIWQRDALRRIIKNDLTQDDINELVGLCKSERGFNSPFNPIPEPQPLVDTDMPTKGVAGSEINLLGILDVENVNAILPKQKMIFGFPGMTIIYGDNASGKTGYARILNQLSHARERWVKILPNVFKPDPAKPATATIEYRVGGENPVEYKDGAENPPFKWRDGGPIPTGFSKISFFDIRCAAIYVNEENDVAFIPYGLDLLPKLAAACRSVQADLRQERESLEAAQPAFLRQIALPPKTKVAIALRNLSCDSSFQIYKSLATLSENELARLNKVREILEQNPIKMAEQLRIRKDRINKLLYIIENIVEILSIKSTEQFMISTRDANIKAEAAMVAATELFNNEPLPNVGGDTWRILWESARRYSEHDAYRGRTFPFIGANALCVLCQQPLDAKALDRMSRFESYVKADTRKAAEESQNALNIIINRMKSIQIRTTDHRDTLKEIAIENVEVRNLLRQYLVFAQLRRRAILKACKSNYWEKLPDLPENPSQGLLSIIQSLKEQAEDLDKAGQSDERALLIAEKDDLDARIWLSTLLDDIRMEIERLKLINLINRCIGDTNTTAITLESGHITNKFITEKLSTSFNNELKKLGLKSTPAKLIPGSGQFGSKRHKITLSGAIGNVKVSQVVSDGEFNCIALAGFLAELCTSQTNSSLIFDDPVSSLDHRLRVKFAERMVEEAKKRQVIIFTHDIVFLFYLREIAEKNGIPLKENHLIRGRDGIGICLDGVPWIAMNVKKRIAFIKNELQRAKEINDKDGYECYKSEGRLLYGLLREAWERAVEEVLLNQAIVRFGREIQTKRLKVVTDINDDDIFLIDEAMSKCSTFMWGHDEAGALNEPVPLPGEVEVDIDKLEGWVREMRKNRNRG